MTEDEAQIGLVLGFIIATLLQSWVFMLATSGIGFGTIFVPMAVAVTVMFLFSKFIATVAKRVSE